MAKLLYIKASPRWDRSYSITVADKFVESYKAAHPNDEIVILDLFKTSLLEFDGHVLDSKYAILHGKEFTSEQKESWVAVEKIIEEFKSADKYVLATPMWNFSIPYKLKHYIDILVQPGYTFSYSPEEGYKGLVTGKSITVVYARGGQYPVGSDFESYDLQTKYMRLILGFIGITDVRELIIEPTLMEGPDVANQKKEEAQNKAQELAKDF